MRIHAIGLTVALAVGACSSTARAPAAAPVADKDVKKATAKDARGLIKELYGSVRRGRGSNMQTLLADTAYVVGPAVADIYATRNQTVAAATEHFELADRHRVRSRGLKAMSSPSGKSAWIFDRVDIDRTRYTLAVVLAQVDEIWYAVAIHLGREPAGKVATPLPPLAGGVDARAEEVVLLVQAGAAAPGQFLDQLAARGETAVIGPGKRDQAAGAKRIARLWKKRKLADKPIAIDGELRAGVTPDAALAWVIANTHSGDAAPQRILWIYEQADGVWKLVLMQWATPKE